MASERAMKKIFQPDWKKVFEPENVMAEVQAIIRARRHSEAAMKLGIGSYAYAWAIGAPGHPPAAPMTAMDLIERAAALGVGLVQICDNVPLHRMSAAELDALHARTRSLGADVEVGTLGIASDHLSTYLRLAERFESPILRVVVDSPGHQPDEDEIVDTIAVLLPDLRAAGVTLAVENHERFKAQDLVRIMERLDSDQSGHLFGYRQFIPVR